jgi:hypothetical protein
MQFLGVWSLSAVYPHAFVEPHGIDNERIAFPAANRVPVVSRGKIFGVGSKVRVYHPEGVRPADIHNVNALEVGHVQNLYAVRCRELAWPTGRLASGVRFHGIRATVIGYGFSPGLKRGIGVSCRTATVPKPLFTRDSG